MRDVCRRGGGLGEVEGVEGGRCSARSREVEGWRLWDLERKLYRCVCVCVWTVVDVEVEWLQRGYVRYVCRCGG